MPSKHRTRHPAPFFANLCIYALFLFWTLLCLPLLLAGSLLSCLLKNRLVRVLRKAMWHFGSVQLFLLRPFLPVVCQNKELAAQHPGSIIVCTHQSFLDLYLFAAQSERNLCFVTKSWPFTKLFFFAPAMRAAGYLDAEALAPEALMQACSARLQEGSTLVFFPEGSRSRNGELGRFHAGAFLVAVREDTAVIPMIIHDSFQIFPPHARFCVPGTIHMELLPPVYPGAFRASDLPHRAMMKEVHRQIKQRRDLFTTGGSL